MRSFFRIKWELILFILLLITSLKTWLTFAYVDSSINTLAVATMSTFALMYIAFGYKTITAFRHEVINLWQ